MRRSGSKELALDAVVSPYDVGRPVNWAAQFGNAGPVTLEIGCGLGEYLVRAAGGALEENFVGIEQDWHRINKTLRRIALARRESGPLDNVRVLPADATVALERLFAPESLRAVVCLFPCPWPKKSHIKHRLFSRGFFRLLNSRMGPGGEGRVVTDFEPFFLWMLDEAQGNGFELRPGRVGPQFDTKFERKWAGQGQTAFWELRLVKSGHIPVPFKEDAAVRTFFSETFDPGRFRMDEVRGEITVVCKDFIYDSRAQKAMVHLVVAEENLTQHVWAMVRKTTRGWLVSKAEGHTVLPSVGVDYALGLVHASVCRTTKP